MAVVSCKHRMHANQVSASAAFIVIARRLKGLAGDLGPSPLSRDVHARAIEHPCRCFLCHTSVSLRRFGKQMFLLHAADG
jgi:hypothetical protein